MEAYILAIGELLIDAITTTQVRNLSQAESLSISPGGSPANFCRYLTRCGTPAQLVATVGDDGLGSILLQKVTAEGINAKHIAKLRNKSTSLIVVGKTSGTPDFVPYRDADRFLEPVSETLISEAILLHTTAFALSSEPARGVILDAFATAVKQGKQVSADWNYSDKIWGDNNDAEEVFAKLQTYLPLLKMSMDDVQRFYGRNLNITEAKAQLDSLNCSVICLTCGSEGVHYKTASGGWEFMASEPVTVKNATGAGDAFWAGFISAWYDKRTVHDCVRQGINTASRKLSGDL